MSEFYNINELEELSKEIDLLKLKINTLNDEVKGKLIDLVHILWKTGKIGNKRIIEEMEKNAIANSFFYKTHSSEILFKGSTTMAKILIIACKERGFEISYDIVESTISLRFECKITKS